MNGCFPSGCRGSVVIYFYNLEGVLLVLREPQTQAGARRAWAPCQFDGQNVSKLPRASMATTIAATTIAATTATTMEQQVNQVRIACSFAILSFNEYECIFSFLIPCLFFGTYIC